MSDLAARRTRVKMCGTTRVEDALAAVRAGVDALGFIFYPKSPRYISVEQAAGIIDRLPPLVDRVGVFVDATVDEVAVAAAAGLSLLQLHGRETPDYCRQLRARLPHCAIIKAFRVGEASRPEDFASYREWVDAFLLDTYQKGTPGGTGTAFDWSIVGRLRLQRPILLAGGLSPDNVAEAILAVHPYAVDVNSGVEVRPGIKDPALLDALLRQVRRADSR